LPDSSPDTPRQSVLLVRAGARLCGLPIASIGETMRPLPVTPLAGAPAFVLGISIVRGEPTPVVDLAALLGGSVARAETTRFVVVRTGARLAALAVGAVLGVVELDPRDARELPLVSDACAGALVSLRARDDDLLLVLGAARLVPDEARAALVRWEAGA
jgi:purine-binding chemotaxis protein CheW